MEPQLRRVWEGLSQTMGQQIALALDQMADRVKDYLLDNLDLDEEDGSPSRLPPVAPDEFVARMREHVEITLRQVALALNRAPGDELPPEIVDLTGDLFTALWQHALATGTEMRHEGARREEAPEEPPAGEWARRFRRMRTTETDRGGDETA